MNWCGFVLAAVCIPAPLGRAQELPTPFFQLGTGDPGLLGNPLEQVNDIAVNRRGEVLYTAYDGVLDQGYTALDAAIVSMVGDPIGNTGFFMVAAGQRISLGPDGRPWSRVTGVSFANSSVSDVFAVSGSAVIIAPGQACTAPSLPAGSFYEEVTDVWSAGHSKCQALVQLSVGGVSRTGIVRITVDAADAIVDEEVLVLEGQPTPGFQGVLQTLFGGLFVGPNASGVVGFDPTYTIVFNGSVAIRPGDPSPYTGLTWSTLGSAAVGASGDWALEGVLSDGKRVIVKNGQPFVHEDDLPAILLSSPNGVRRMVPVSMSSRGRLVWRVEQSLTNPGANAGSYFVEQKPMAQSWRVQFEGEPFTFGTQFWGIDPDGVYLGFGGGPVSSVGTPSISNLVAAFPLDQSDPACGNPAASTGDDPIVSVHGSPWLADGTDFEIMTRRLPVQAFALTLVSSSPSPGAPVTGAIGDLCLGGTIFRSPILRANGLGTTRAWLSDFPIPPGAEPAVGETWRFQTWYRDVDTTSGAPVSRFTEAVEMPFL